MKEEQRRSTLTKKKNLRRKVKIILLISSILLFILNYKICDLFYPEDIDKWWGLKSNIYGVIMGLVFISSSIGTKGLVRLIFNIGIGFTTSNIIDKCYFNVLEFRYNDIIMIILTLCLSFYEYLSYYQKCQKKQTQSY